MSENNKKAYNSDKVVKNYTEKFFLFKGEHNLIERLKSNSNNGKMLDIGIGTGRTTHFFAKYSDKYVGIDYAANMIKFAKEKYKDKSNCSFYELDATNMSIFNDNEFDFILFSFNGLDCVTIDDRIKILKEIKRVAKNGAIFSYSTHNIYNIPKLFKFSNHGGSGSFNRCAPSFYFLRRISYNQHAGSHRHTFEYFKICKTEKQKLKSSLPAAI